MLAAIDEVGGQAVLRLVHGTFHHHLADEGELFPERTGLVHISGVEDRSLTKETTRDAHRVLVAPVGLMDNVGQSRALLDAGCAGNDNDDATGQRLRQGGSRRCRAPR